jgi:hypothetical protein
MNLLNNDSIRKAALLIAPLGLLSGGTLLAHDSYADGRSTQYHQQDEKQALKEHQREERKYYGNSRALRDHQKQEKRQVREHQRIERDYGDRDYRYSDRGYGAYDRDNRYGSGRYYGRRY